MKKGFVALLLLLAVIVLVSPGIVGRLAEKSMDENLDWAATESQKVVVTSRGFDRGWFSSEGQHRIEILDGELRSELLAIAGNGDAKDLPVLVIDTRLDHGIVPLASLSRDKGSLLPGLGSAVSTVSLELGSGERVALPGKIYSDISLTGDLRSNFVLGGGTFEQDSNKIYWGDVDIDVTIDPAGGAVAYDGSIESLQAFGDAQAFDLGRITFSGQRQPTPFGVSTGDFRLTVASVNMEAYGRDEDVGPLSLDSEARLNGDRYDGRVELQLENTPFGEFGQADISTDIRVTGIDAEALGRISQLADKMPNGNQDDVFFAVENDLKIMFASGFEVHVDQIEIALPQGPIRSELRVAIAESNADTFNWGSLLLAVDATVSLRIPAELVEIAIDIEPQINAAIGLGYLKRSGEIYEMEAAFQKGLLTVNGAPMPIPLPGGTTQ